MVIRWISRLTKRWQTGTFCRIEGMNLIANELKDLGAWTYEDEVIVRAGGRKSGVFREKAVARVHGVSTGQPGHANDLFHCEVRAHRMSAFANLVTLVGLLAVHRISVFEREDRDRSNVELVRGAKGSNRYFAAIGDEEFTNHGVSESLGCREPKCVHAYTKSMNG
jgi:hypothetical protein